jgi:ribosome-associated protein
LDSTEAYDSEKLEGKKLQINDPFVKRAIAAAQDKKALDLVLLDLKKVGSFTDCFIICSGTSAPQNQAIADEIELSLKKMHRRPNHIEGYSQAEWILLDYSDFIVHILLPKARTFYNLERLWRDVPRTDIPEAV